MGPLPCSFARLFCSCCAAGLLLLLLLVVPPWVCPWWLAVCCVFNRERDNSIDESSPPSLAALDEYRGNRLGILTCGGGPSFLLVYITICEPIAVHQPFGSGETRELGGGSQCSHVCSSLLFSFVAFINIIFFSLLVEFLNAHILSWEMFFSAWVSHSLVISRLGFFSSFFVFQ